MECRELMATKYREILEQYIHNPSEQILYQGQKFSRKLIEHRISPEEVISLHKMMMVDMYPDLPEEYKQSFDVLLEVMLGYGLAYREHQSLRHKQQELRTEMEIAANVQQTLLGTRIPNVEWLDIGAISVPAKHMNGDYYHFVQDEKNNISIAIADVIGKGIPAALCMSMIKYAMDSQLENSLEPNKVLENLNHVVEQNVDPSMFITMFYGCYHVDLNTFTFSSAGHEPGYFYHAATGEFREIHARGLLLGVEKKTKYPLYEQPIEMNDMIILMSDGVTECRSDEGFIDKETLVSYIKAYIHLPAQEIVTNIYKELEKLQHFQLRDDFTLIILKRKV